ncbi:MAG: hypothetical protein ACI8ZF_000376 [Candidatus Midichloriaceae bacterium]|jgi:uncharacterized protein (TIGR02217 family)
MNINNFNEIRFPEDISYGAIGGPEFYTDVISTLNKNEYRQLNFGISKMKYDISYGIKNQEQIEKLLYFFRARHGKAIGFRFKDWCDYKAKKEELEDANDIYTKFQLRKIYKNGEGEYSREITKPVEKTVSLYIGDKQYNDPFDVDYMTGIVTLDTPLKKEEQLSANFEFDVPVRFDNDYLPISINAFENYSVKNINLIEIK